MLQKMLLIFICTSVVSCSSLSKVDVVPGVSILPDEASLSTRSFDSLHKYFEGKSVVQLGEGIHMTHEFPLYRYALAKSLFDNLRFDIILFEGSMIEAWLASDKLLNASSNQPIDKHKIRDIAFFPLWRSDEYNDFFNHPFYVASYDIQPGMGSLRSQALPEFLKALTAYSPAPKNLENWIHYLSFFSDRNKGFPNNPIPSKQEIIGCIKQLEVWINTIVPIINSKYPSVPHAKILKLIPTALRYQLDLWEAHLADPDKNKMNVYQKTRDRYGAKLILLVQKEASATKNIIVWAHHVHVFHNVQAKARHSLGNDLKKVLGEKLYTVGLFAGSGYTYGLNFEQVTEGALSDISNYGFENSLSLLAPSNKNIFVDFKTLRGQSDDQKWLNSPTLSRLEVNEYLAVIPAADFDAAIYIRKIQKPGLNF